jgi:beta-glucanase (GH16 family)
MRLLALLLTMLVLCASALGQNQTSFAGSMPQIASAGGWDTSLTLVNLSTSQGEALLYFYANDGSALSLPFTFPQQPSLGTTVGASFDETLDAKATLILDTTGSGQVAAVGSSQMLTSGNIGGFAIFTYTPSGQAAVVPLETRNASSYLLPFDNTGQVSTGLAIANVANSAADVNVVIRDDTGTQIGTGAINLAGEGHNSFMLTDSTYGFPATAGVRGTVEFDTPQGGQISVLGLRANAIPNSTNFAVTTIPTLANVGTGGGTMAHIASGGGWQTTLTLVNTGTSAATANLNFYGDDGSAVSLPLSFPQTGATSTATNVSQSIAAGASLIVVLQDGAASTTTGSAVLTTAGNVGGFAVFRYNTTGQEAVVPLEAVSALSYILAFDNTGTLATGLAIANVAGQAASVNVVIRDDTGAQIGTGSISLPANGHTSFMLTDAAQGFPATAGVRGTVEFDTPSGGQIAPLGLRAASIPGGFTITTVPVMATSTSTGACSGVSNITVGSTTYTPAWCQEFTGSAGPPSTTAWHYDLGNNGGWGNGEVEVYCGPPGYAGNPSQCPTTFSTSTAPVYIDGNGHLVIQPRNVGGTWISARMNTEGIQNFQYGILVASIELPDTTNQGLWPAFWTLGSDITTIAWPTCGEADIMENWSPQVNGGAGDTGNNSTIHTALTGGSGIGTRYTFPSGEATNTGFHTYGIVWTANEMQFFVDNSSSPFFTITPSSLPSGDTWPFNANLFAILNVAVGGTLGGSTSGLSNPGPMTVDYVRWYTAQ